MERMEKSIRVPCVSKKFKDLENPKNKSKLPMMPPTASSNNKRFVKSVELFKQSMILKRELKPICKVKSIRVS